MAASTCTPRFWHWAEAATDTICPRNLSHFRIVPPQLSGVAWRTVLGFETIYVLNIPDACQREVFYVAYALRKTRQGARFFVAQSGCEKLILNMVDNDYGTRDTAVWVCGPWEVESEDERRAIPTT